jgi:ABC-type lipoprotein release transport system permease subunit
MSAAWTVFRARMRRRWRAWVALALLIGLFAAAVTALAAGARRTDSAYPRLLTWSRAPDLMFYTADSESATFASPSVANIERLPVATATAAVSSYTVLSPGDAEIYAPQTNVIPEVFFRRKILSGRLPDPGRVNEADVSFTLAQQHHLRVGDWLRLTLLSLRGRPPVVRFRIVGIDAAPSEFPPQTGSGINLVWATPAFYRHEQGQPVEDGIAVAMQVRDGAAGVPVALQDARRLGAGKLLLNYPLAVQAVNTERSIHLLTVALWLLAGLIGLVGLLITGQLLARLSFVESDDYATLRALGMSRGQLLAAELGRTALIGAGAGAVGAALAVALSPLFPVGLAAIAEPYPGLDADPLVLTAGFLGAIVVTVACAAWPAWRAAAEHSTRPPSPARASSGWRAVAAATSSFGPVPAMIGVRLALRRGTGRSAVPVFSTVTGAVVGVAAVCGALVFSTSLSYLFSRPSLYGVTWDASVQSLGSDGIQAAIPAVASDPRVSAWATGYAGAPIRIDGISADSMAMSPGHQGSLQPVVTQGRMPERPGEIALGARTLAAVGGRLGGTVSVSLGGGQRLGATIVGVAVFPTFSDTLSLGGGSAVTVGELRRLLPQGVPLPAPDTMLIRFRPGIAPAAGMAALTARLDQLGPFDVQPASTPTDLVNFGRVHAMPLLVGGALGALAVLTITHLLITSVRRRWRDFAVLRTIGFTRGQVRRTVAWQAGTLMAAALAVGIPAGIVCGRLAWLVFAHQLGIVAYPDVPLLLTVALAAGALALAVVVAVLPGEAAARANPTEALRSE